MGAVLRCLKTRAAQLRTIPLKGLLKVQGYGAGRDITHSPMVQTPCMSTRPGSVAAWRRITHDSIPSSHWLQVDRTRHDRPPHHCPTSFCRFLRRPVTTAPPRVSKKYGGDGTQAGPLGRA